jgi:RNA polymerase sigma factor (sigma-70 family)
MLTEDTEFAAILAGLEAGDQKAAREIYERFVDRLVKLASNRIDRKLQAKVDPESVAHSALMSFFDRQRDGEYQLHNWGMVLGLLSHITFRKCLNRNRYFRQQRRNDQDSVPFDDWRGVSQEPGPAEEAILREMLERAMAALQQPHRRTIVELYLDGHSMDEVAQRTGVSKRTVERAVHDFGKALEKEIARAQEP